MLGIGLVKAHVLLWRIKPSVVVGFGGYPTVPPLLAATQRGVPTLIHEQNAVMGRANRLLAPRVQGIATSFAGVLDAAPKLAAKATHTGNPLRPAVIAAAAPGFVAPEADGLFRLLVFGGSQGAKIMSDIVPDAIGELDLALRSRLLLAQQAREEDLLRVRDIYARLRISAEVAPFFADLPARIAAAHLVVSRSGAGTVAELAAIGRPAILVPLPHALDQDQFANAGVLDKAGGALRLRQEEFTPARLAAEIARLASAPQKTRSNGRGRPFAKCHRRRRAARRSGGESCGTGRESVSFSLSLPLKGGGKGGLRPPFLVLRTTMRGIGFGAQRARWGFRLLRVSVTPTWSPAATCPPPCKGG